MVLLNYFPSLQYSQKKVKRKHRESVDCQNKHISRYELNTLFNQF